MTQIELNIITDYRRGSTMVELYNRYGKIVTKGDIRGFSYYVNNLIRSVK